MILLDTHVVLWLYEGLLEKLSKKARDLVEEEPLLISAMTELELQFLFEIKRITRPAIKILQELERNIGLSVCDIDFASIVYKAIDLTWTRDPCDRIITANAMARNCALLTKDQTIRKHCSLAVW